METVTSEVQLVSGTSCEFLTSQIQDFSGSILCVRNGWQILVYPDSSTIPQNLRLEFEKANPSINTVEYHYRCSDGDLYVFFVPELKTWMESGRRGLFYLMVDVGATIPEPKGGETAVTGDLNISTTVFPDRSDDAGNGGDHKSEQSRAASSVPISDFSDDDDDLIHLINPSSQVELISSLPINRSNST